MNTQRDAPIEEGSDEATVEESIQGVLEQVRADIEVGHTHESVLTLLHERFTQSRIEISIERKEELAEQLMVIARRTKTPVKSIGHPSQSTRPIKWTGQSNNRFN